ncbi:hypothetical protein BpHYR1_054285 [Brachionus plicatilis]|uniref:Uncharacterized protein n=1 Tax=Brachionus plicatilis TaxID=10195 RepID=A0A3M7S4L4_BRAPC|nr:hypothetical protein BpHYR1_054285 [Brachionus plicatilis]
MHPTNKLSAPLLTPHHICSTSSAHRTLQVTSIEQWSSLTYIQTPPPRPVLSFRYKIYTVSRTRNTKSQIHIQYVAFPTYPAGQQAP